MLKKIKSQLLTKWFVEWVNNESDIDTLELTRQMIESRQNQISPRTQIIGFQIPNTINKRKIK
jgi:hypothetical protein